MFLKRLHSYEELRGIVIDILLRKEPTAYPPEQYNALVAGVAEVLFRRGEREVEQSGAGYIQVEAHRVRLKDEDAELVRDVFWDLFRQGYITLGLNDSNREWPFFRLSHYGKQTIDKQSLFRFHDVGSFLGLVRGAVPDISAEAVTYLEEAVATFYADCLLASAVMLGVAAEAEFERALEFADQSAHGALFAKARKERFIGSQIPHFRNAIAQLKNQMGKDLADELETHLDAIQTVLRVARNQAGHPKALKISREQMYIYLQLFVPFAAKLADLRSFLT